jgi:hypothetical protein
VREGEEGGILEVDALGLGEVDAVFSERDFFEIGGDESDGGGDNFVLDLVGVGE